MSTTLVVMGVSGSGKTTVARGVAEALGWVFAEGDDAHSAASVAKMTAGIPLTDDDRWPWLRRLSSWIGEREAYDESAVLTCSALRRAYRNVLREGHPSVRFAHVSVSPQLLRQRLAHRTGHYLDPALLPSQLATLEPLADDEPGIVLPGDGPPDEVVRQLTEFAVGMT